MDRTAWLRERRRMTEERFDTRYAPTYDQDEGDIGPTHRRFVAELLRRWPPGGHLYLTIELVDAEELERVFAEATADGLPVARGEHTTAWAATSTRATM